MGKILCEELEEENVIKMMKDQIRLIIDNVDEKVVEIGTPTTEDFRKSYQRSRDVAIRYGQDISGLPRRLNRIKIIHLKYKK